MITVSSFFIVTPKLLLENWNKSNVHMTFEVLLLQFFYGRVLSLFCHWPVDFSNKFLKQFLPITEIICWQLQARPGFFVIPFRSVLHSLQLVILKNPMTGSIVCSEASQTIEEKFSSICLAKMETANSYNFCSERFSRRSIFTSQRSIDTFQLKFRNTSFKFVMGSCCDQLLCIASIEMNVQQQHQ